MFWDLAAPWLGVLLVVVLLVGLIWLAGRAPRSRP